MKNFIPNLTIILLFNIGAFSQTININQQAIVRPNIGNYITVMQNGQAKRVSEGELRDSISLPLIATGPSLLSIPSVLKVGGKFTLINSTDTMEVTKINTNTFHANEIRGYNGSVPPLEINVGNNRVKLKNAIWKNPNISIINGQTIDFTLQNGLWKPIKGFLNPIDFGAKGDSVTDDSDAIQACFNYIKYGNIEFTEGKYRITKSINIVSSSISSIERKERRITSRGATILCTGYISNAFVFSAAAYPNSSWNLNVEFLVFSGNVTNAFIKINANNMYDNINFKHITATEQAIAPNMFQFENGNNSNLGGVLIERCSASPSVDTFIHLKGSLVYPQFDNFKILDNSNLGSDNTKKHFLYLNNALLQYSTIARNVDVTKGRYGIGNVNQYIAESTIESFYSEPKANDYTSIACELRDCKVTQVVSTVADFTRKNIKVYQGGVPKSVDFDNCKVWNGIIEPYTKGSYPVISATYGIRIKVNGTIEQYFKNAVQYTKPDAIQPDKPQKIIVSNAVNDRQITAGQTKTLYTFTKAGGGIDYDETDEIYKCVIIGQVFGGNTNVDFNINITDGTTTHILSTISRSALVTSSQPFKFEFYLRIDGANNKFQILFGSAVWNNSITTIPSGVYALRGDITRTANPTLKATCNTLNVAGLEVNFVDIQKVKSISDYGW